MIYEGLDKRSKSYKFVARWSDKTNLNSLFHQWIYKKLLMNSIE